MSSRRTATNSIVLPASAEHFSRACSRAVAARCRARNNQQRGCNWARDYEFGATLARLLGPIAQLGERCVARRRSPVRARLGPPESRPRGGFRSSSPPAAAQPPRRSRAVRRTAAFDRSSTPRSRWIASSSNRSRSSAANRTCSAHRSSSRSISAVRPCAASASVRSLPMPRRGTSISIVSATAGFIPAKREFYACLRSKRGTSAWRGAGSRNCSARTSSRRTRWAVLTNGSRRT